jgi:antitoxin ParD1/3/4
MVNMNITIPEGMKSWVDDQTDTGRYADASDYIRDLIRRDQQQSDKIAAIQTLVDEGLQSGVSDETMADILASMTSAKG